MRNLSLRNWLLIIFFLSFALRTAFMLVPQVNYFNKVLPVKFKAEEQISDDKTYTTLAYGVLKYGFPAKKDKFSMYAGFFYPYVVAINLAFSNNLIYLFFFHIILDSLTAVLIVLIVLKLLNKINVALIAGLLYATYYPNFIFPPRVLTESFFTFMLVLAFYFLQKGIEKKGIKEFFIFGSLLSVAALTKSMIFYVFFFVYLYLVYRAFFKKDITKYVAAIIVLFFVIQSPYYIVSYINTNKFIVGSSNGWYMILTGTYLPLKGDEPKDPEYDIFTDHPVGKVYMFEWYHGWNEFQMDSAFTALGKKQLKENFTQHPIESVEVMLLQLSRFWFHMPYYIRPIPGTGTVIAAIYKFILTIFMIVGIWKLVFKEKNNYARIILFFLLIYTSLHSLVFSSLRYSAPLVPFMIIFASAGIYFAFKEKFNKIDSVLLSSNEQQ